MHGARSIPNSAYNTTRVAARRAIGKLNTMYSGLPIAREDSRTYSCDAVAIAGVENAVAKDGAGVVNWRSSVLRARSSAG
jgi:hypothetical protein